MNQVDFADMLLYGSKLLDDPTVGVDAHHHLSNIITQSDCFELVVAALVPSPILGTHVIRE